MAEEGKVKANDPQVAKATAELAEAIIDHDGYAFSYYHFGPPAMTEEIYKKKCAELAMAHAKLAGVSAANVIDMMIEHGVLENHSKEQ